MKVQIKSGTCEPRRRLSETHKLMSKSNSNQHPVGLHLTAAIPLSVAQVHAYERWDPQLNYTHNECGPIHITIGDGGNVEGVRIRFRAFGVFRVEGFHAVTAGPERSECELTVWRSALLCADLQDVHRHCSTAGHLQPDPAAD